MTFQEWYKTASTGYVNLSEDSARIGWNAALNQGAQKPTTNNARVPILCETCQRKNVCNPYHKYGIAAVECWKYVERSGSAPIA